MNSSLAALFTKAKTIAIIGAKDKPGTAVDRVGQYLINAGYTVYPVHPVRQNIWNLPTYTSVLEIPGPIDIVDVFRAPEFCAAHAHECLQLQTQPLCFWMQLGITSAEAKAILEPKNILVIENKCTMVEHAQCNQLQKLRPL